MNAFIQAKNKAFGKVIKMAESPEETSIKKFTFLCTSKIRQDSNASIQGAKGLLRKENWDVGRLTMYVKLGDIFEVIWLARPYDSRLNSQLLKNVFKSTRAVPFLH